MSSTPTFLTTTPPINPTAGGASTAANNRIDLHGGGTLIIEGIISGDLKINSATTVVVNGGAIRGGVVEMGPDSTLKVNIHPFRVPLRFRGETELAIVSPGSLPMTVKITKPEELLALQIPAGSSIKVQSVGAPFSEKESIVLVHVGSSDTPVIVTHLPFDQYQPPTVANPPVVTPPVTLPPLPPAPSNPTGPSNPPITCPKPSFPTWPMPTLPIAFPINSINILKYFNKFL